MLIVIGSVGVVATWASVSFLEAERATGEVAGRDLRRYTTLVPAFLAAMVLAVVANNLGLLWAAVEATTIVTAFLVGHRRGRGSVEATWKYVIICSVGIALAYLGTILVYYAARETGIPADAALDWSRLAAHAGRARPRRDADRLRSPAARVRRQGGHDPAAQLARGRTQSGPRSGVGADVGRPAPGGGLRPDPLPGDRGRQPRRCLRPQPAPGRGAACRSRSPRP